MWLIYARQQAWLAALAAMTGHMAQAEAWLYEVMAICANTEREPAAIIN